MNARATSTFAALRIFIFVALMISSGVFWLVQLSSAGSETGGWLLFASIVLLFGWSFILYRRERLLAWLCWLTVLATFLLSVWLR
jgi:hypothetical protein